MGTEQPWFNHARYDNLGRQLTAMESGGSLSRTTSTAYDDVNLVVTTTQSDTTSQSLVTTTYYDPLGRVRLSVDGDGNSVSKAYRYVSANSASYELQSNPYGTTADSATVGWTLTTHDQVGRVTKVDHYSGSAPPTPWGGNTANTGESTVTYDQNGAGWSCAGPVSSTTDEAGNVHSSCPDGLGRLVSVTEPDPVSGGPGIVTNYTYDVLNNLSAVDIGVQSYSTCTLPGSSATHMRCFNYSTLSRLMSATNPESGTTSYVYDANGNMTTRKDADGNVTSVAGYDALNRPGSIVSVRPTPVVNRDS